jgi:hypothetical protein
MLYGKMLRLNVASELQRSEEYDNTSFHEEEDNQQSAHDLHMDEQASNSRDLYDDSIISGSIDILLHPTYQVPSPFLRLWNRSGSYLTLDQAQAFLDQHVLRDQSSIETQENVASTHAVFPLGRLIQDLHPYDGNACYTIHVCEVSNYIDVLYQSKELNSVAIEKVYMLLWFSMIGPHLGLALSPYDYRAAIDMLTR